MSRLLLFIPLITLAFTLANPNTALAATPDPTLIPTFHSLSIYWNPSGGSSNVQASVEYQAQGTSNWKTGYPLIFDGRSVPSPASPGYRGSLVHLEPGKTYNLKLTLSNHTTWQGTFTTWSENFPIGQTHTVSNQIDPLTINASGNTNGYVVYNGNGSTIDVHKDYDHNIIVNGSYVIIRGFNLKNARRDAIEISNDSHHIVIEENNVSLWGSSGDYTGTDFRSAAIRSGDNDGYSSQNPNIKQIVIQRNSIHSPSIDGTYWDEDPSHAHPTGPLAVSLFNSGGNHVIRYNHIYSTNGNYYNDILGAGSNRSYEGFPTADTDIYSNHLSHAWDDAIEAEGGNRNVRIWGNYMDKSYVGVAIASTSTGPIYIWRNIMNTAQKYPSVTDKGDGAFIKSGGSGEYNYGPVFVFHNTLLQPPGSTYNLGVRVGIGDWGGTMTNLTSRNNILEVNRSSAGSVEASPQITNTFDYDLYNGQIKDTVGSQETHGVSGRPTYSSSNQLVDGKGDFTLSSNSLGYDSGIRLNNFNDSYTGSAPDMGAHEAGSLPMEFGVNAYRNSSPTPTNNPPSPTPRPPSPTPNPNDLDSDSDVDIFDYLILLSGYPESGINSINRLIQSL